ncbi:MAG: ATP-binding protein, partial [Desulforhabdus sp.]|nr:ATP-binding protein [Desulforhabdus sp.]
QMKTDFISHVSHELRTPLTAMREGTAILLEEIGGPLTASQRKVLEVLSSNSDRLYRSICSILDLSKMEAGMMEYQLAPCDAAALIHRSVTSVELIARTKGVDLESNLPENLPVIYADEERIQQVLDNLLGNALKFTPEGGKIIIGARLTTENESGRLLEVSVSDSGEGIPAEDLQRVFQRFYQSPTKTGRSRQGTGLGLAIARHIVEDHRGRIRVKSEPGIGSTFSFTLPIWAANSR